MKASRKTKSQLVEELEALRARVAELEQAINDCQRVEPVRDATEGHHASIADTPLRAGIAASLLGTPYTLQALVDALPDAVYFKDTQSRFILVNKANLKGLGAATLEEVIGRTDFDFFPHDLAARLYQEEQELFRTGRPIFYDNERQDGSWADKACWALVTKVPLQDDDGRIVGLAGLNRDIASLRQAERRLRLLSNAMQQTPAGMVVVDGDGNLAFVNKAAAAMHGSSVADLRGKSISMVHSPDAMASVEAALAEIRASGRHESEIWGKRPDGTAVPILISGSILRDEAGKAEGVVATMLDITERREAEEALRNELERSRLIIDTSLDGFVFVDSEGRSHAPNPALCDMLGYSAKEIEALHVFDLDQDETAETFAERLAAITETGSARFETRVRRKDGAIVTIEVSTRAEEVGGTLLCASFMRDITERKRAEDALRESEARYEETISSIDDNIFRYEVDAQGGLVADYSSSAVERMLGLPAGSIGHSFEEFFTHVLSEDLPAVRTAMASALTEVGEKTSVEYRMRKADGSILWCRSHGRARRQPNGHTVLCGITTNITERKQAEDALRDAHDRWESLLHNSSDHVLVVDEDGRIEEINRTISHRTPADLIGTTLFEYIPEEQHPVLRSALKGVFGHGLQQGYTTCSDVPKLGTVWFDNKLIPVKKEGRVVKAILIARNISEQIQFEAALRESEEKYRSLIETTETGFVIIDTEGKVIDANEEYVRLTGHDSLEAIRGRGVLEWTAPYHIERNMSAVAECAKCGKTRGLEIDYLAPDGRLTPIEVYATVVPGHCGPVIYSLCRDITEHKEKRAEKDRLIRAVENAADPIGICDQDAGLIYANAAMVRTFGCERMNDMYGQAWLTFLQDGARWWQEEVLPRLKHEGTWHGRLSARSADGVTVPLRAMLSRVGESAEDFTVVANIHDMTDDDRYVAQIRKMSLDATMILEQERTIVSRELHDQLGQILTAMRMSLSWLKQRTKTAEPLIQERVAHCHELAGQMIDTVRDLTRALRPAFREHERFADAARAHVDEFRRITGISCSLCFEPDDLQVSEPFATTVYRIMQQALTNIAQHARASSCHVCLRRNDDGFEMTVQDNGVGASPERLAGTLTLGLQGMRERAAMLGGSVRFENAEEGGLCVTLTLPSTD